MNDWETSSSCGGDPRTVPIGSLVAWWGGDHHPVRWCVLLESGVFPTGLGELFIWHLLEVDGRVSRVSPRWYGGREGEIVRGFVGWGVPRSM